ncbi:MAG: IclR family transcriptional regulator [Ardenticatenaceae bacterium]
MQKIRTIDRAFSILQLLSKHPDGMGVSAIAAELELAKSTISRLLGTMYAWEVVERMADNRFRIGPALARWVSHQPFTTTLPLLARPILQKIADETGEAVAICVLEGFELLYLDHVNSYQDIQVRDWTGELIPPHVTSAGKILLAYATPDFVDRFLLKPLASFTEKSIVDPLAFKKELIAVRQKGEAMSDEEFGVGIMGLAVPVFNRHGNVIAALNLYGPKFRLNSPAKQTQIMQKMKAGAQSLATS